MVDAAADGTIGVACPADRDRPRVRRVSELSPVAAIDVSTGRWSSGIQFDASGVPTIVADGNIAAPTSAAAAAPSPPGTRPVTLDLAARPARQSRAVLAIGADNSNVLTVVELDPTHVAAAVARRASRSRTRRRATSASRASRSRRRSAWAARTGIINDDTAPGGQSQFVYAVATDNTVRVADILTLNKECDTQVDPRFMHGEKDMTQAVVLPGRRSGDPAAPRPARAARASS